MGGALPVVGGASGAEPQYVPGLPGAPQDDAGLTRKFEMSHVGGATCRTTPISRSALEINLKPRHLFEGNPVGEGTK